jgi:hypothetical protein
MENILVKNKDKTNVASEREGRVTVVFCGSAVQRDCSVLWQCCAK